LGCLGIIYPVTSLTEPLSREPSSNEAETINETLKLAFELLEIVESNKLDYTNSFRALIAVVDAENYPYEAGLLQQIDSELDSEQLTVWHQWRQRYLSHIEKVAATHKLNPDAETANTSADSAKAAVIEQLTQSNPVYVLRNAMAQRAIEQAQSGDFSEVDRLFQLLTTPYQLHELATKQDITPLDRAAKPLVISCSS